MKTRAEDLEIVELIREYQNKVLPICGEALGRIQSKKFNQKCVCVCSRVGVKLEKHSCFQAPETFGVSSCAADKSVYKCVMVAKGKLMWFWVIKIEEKFLLEQLCES